MSRQLRDAEIGGDEEGSTSAGGQTMSSAAVESEGSGPVSLSQILERDVYASFPAPTDSSEASSGASVRRGAGGGGCSGDSAPSGSDVSDSVDNVGADDGLGKFTLSFRSDEARSNTMHPSSPPSSGRILPSPCRILSILTAASLFGAENYGKRLFCRILRKV